MLPPSLRKMLGTAPSVTQANAKPTKERIRYLVDLIWAVLWEPRFITTDRKRSNKTMGNSQRTLVEGGHRHQSNMEALALAHATHLSSMK